MSIVSIIPARGGSKGIPKKNIKLLKEKPVIYYSIEASNSCSLINNTYVSTENKEIADISRNFGADIIDRPLELAKDTSSTVDVIFHALDYLEDNDLLPELFVLLQPTSPLRTSQDIEKAISLFLDNDCDSLVSVCELEHQYLLNFYLDNDYLIQNNDASFFSSRRQDLPKYYALNGAIYITTPDFIRKNKSFYSKKTIPYIMSKEKSIDLDTPFDFKLVEFLLNE